MDVGITIQKVESGDHAFIELISDWYLKEWSIPVEKTHLRLSNIPNDDVIFQLILMEDRVPVSTGGLYNILNLHNVYPEFKKLGPWVALLYTREESRGRGFGNLLLQKTEDISQEMGFKEIYLHTFTAERLYLRNKWEVVERAPYKGNITVIMKKEL